MLAPTALMMRTTLRLVRASALDDTLVLHFDLKGGPSMRLRTHASAIALAATVPSRRPESGSWRCACRAWRRARGARRNHSGAEASAISPSCRRDRPLLTAMLVTTMFWWPCAGNVTVGGRTVLRHSLQACILGLPKRPTPVTKPNHITSPNRSARALKIQQPTAISEAWRTAGPLLPPCACLAPAPRPSLPALVTIWSHPCQTWKRVLRALLLMNRPNPKRAPTPPTALTAHARDASSTPRPHHHSRLTMLLILTNDAELGAMRRTHSDGTSGRTLSRTLD
jgi:hypothetical protein